jgi:hypothetical protein
VERVYLVDNASTDDTVARAVGAGAELAEVFRTACSQESLRILIMNSVVWRVSSAESSEHVWWLWLDADEFPEGPEGQTIKQYLDGLDRRFRVVGSRYYQHFPDYKPEYIHERIAYSKLPEHTFRFRWEDGRVQFYDNGVGRFPLAATRKEPLALLTWDLGFWDRESGEAKLTDKGAAFIEEVLS